MKRRPPVRGEDRRPPLWGCRAGREGVSISRADRSPVGVLSACPGVRRAFHLCRDYFYEMAITVRHVRGGRRGWARSAPNPRGGARAGAPPPPFRLPYPVQPFWPEARVTQAVASPASFTVIIWV